MILFSSTILHTDENRLGTSKNENFLKIRKSRQTSFLLLENALGSSREKKKKTTSATGKGRSTYSTRH